MKDDFTFIFLYADVTFIVEIIFETHKHIKKFRWIFNGCFISFP